MDHHVTITPVNKNCFQSILGIFLNLPIDSPFAPFERLQAFVRVQPASEPCSGSRKFAMNKTRSARWIYQVSTAVALAILVSACASGSETDFKADASEVSDEQGDKIHVFSFAY